MRNHELPIAFFLFAIEGPAREKYFCVSSLPDISLLFIDHDQQRALIRLCRTFAGIEQQLSLSDMPQHRLTVQHIEPTATICTLFWATAYLETWLRCVTAATRCISLIHTDHTAASTSGAFWRGFWGGGVELGETRSTQPVAWSVDGVG